MTTSISVPTRFRAVGVFAGFALIACALTACTTGTGSDDPSGANEGSESQQYDKWVADFDACMQRAGFDADTTLGPADTDARAADEDCRKVLGDAPVDAYDPNDPVQQDVDRASTEAEHKCYARLGYDVPTDASQTPDDITEGDLATCMTEGQEAGEKARTAAK